MTTWLLLLPVAVYLLYKNRMKLIYYAITLYNKFYSVDSESNSIRKIVTKNYIIESCTPEILRIHMNNLKMGPEVNMLVYFTQNGRDYIFPTTVSRLNDSFFPYPLDVESTNEIIAAMISETEDVTEKLKKFAGPKCNFYYDLGLRIKPSDIFPGIKAAPQENLNLMIDSSIIEVPIDRVIYEVIMEQTSESDPEETLKSPAEQLLKSPAEQLLKSPVESDAETVELEETVEPEETVEAK